MLKYDWLTCPHCITNKVNFLSFRLWSVAAANETSRALGNSPPVTEIRGSSKPSAYAGGISLENAVLDLPQSGLCRLLQLPSAVRYLDCLQSGSSMQYFSRSVLSNEYFNSPSLASSFVNLNLKSKSVLFLNWMRRLSGTFLKKNPQIIKSSD